MIPNARTRMNSAAYLATAGSGGRRSVVHGRAQHYLWAQVQGMARGQPI